MGDEEADRFIRQARKTAEREALRDRPLLALLTGSAAWGSTSSRSDIDIIFITSKRDAVSYRYYIPELTGVAIRTEVGRIPISYLEKVLESGYADEISTGLREQLRNARLLAGDSKLAEQVIASFGSLKPRKRLLGEYLFGARRALQDARDCLAEARPAGATLAADRFAKNIWRLVLVAKHGVGVQKEKHEIRAARRELGEAALAQYETSRRIAGTTGQAAREALVASEKVITRVFELAGIDGSIVGGIDQ